MAPNVVTVMRKSFATGAFIGTPGIKKYFSDNQVPY
jgi:hypothetical protein